MRLICLFACAAMLAGCEAPDEADDGAGPDNVLAAPGPGSRDPVAPVDIAGSSPKTAEPDNVIPERFRGTYDASVEACGRPSIERLVIDEEALRFHESVGTARRVAADGEQALQITADYEGEGERWSAARRLELSEGGSKLTITGDGLSIVKLRCR